MANKGIPFKRFSATLDCSRNAVITVEAFQKWVDIIAPMGYNCTTLYMEDTYEIDGHPYFGYGRGRYSKAELKEMNAYARSKGVEMFPSINTLGHLSTIFRWPQYNAINDASDILLCEDERTYELIEKMIATCAECFDSRIISVSMDEAELLGRGKYLELHGYQKSLDILKRHMARVCEITDKYGYEMMLVAGDMPVRLATGNDSYIDPNKTVTEDVSDLMPQNAALMYWEYYKRDKDIYKAHIDIHQQIKKDNLWYLGALWNWHSFSPENYYSTRALRNSIQACREMGVENVEICTYGDDGAECGRFAVLPSLFYASRIAAGITDEEQIKQEFEAMFHIAYDDFLLLDLTQRKEGEIYGSHPQRYILYNDPFIGLMDLTIPDYTRTDHEELMELLKPHCSHPAWGYLFQTMYDLCAVTAAKCDVGMRIRAAYEAGDKEKLAWYAMNNLMQCVNGVHAIAQRVTKEYALYPAPDISTHKVARGHCNRIAQHHRIAHNNCISKRGNSDTLSVALGASEAYSKRGYLLGIALALSAKLRQLQLQNLDRGGRLTTLGAIVLYTLK